MSKNHILMIERDLRNHLMQPTGGLNSPLAIILLLFGYYYYWWRILWLPGSPIHFHLMPIIRNSSDINSHTDADINLLVSPWFSPLDKHSTFPNLSLPDSHDESCNTGRSYHIPVSLLLQVTFSFYLSELYTLHGWVAWYMLYCEFVWKGTTET